MDQMTRNSKQYLIFLLAEEALACALSVVDPQALL